MATCARLTVVVLTALLAGGSFAQGRDPVSPGVGRAVLLATHSIQIDQEVVVVSGDLVVNDLAAGPFLGEAQLALDRGASTPPGARLIANSIDIDRGAYIGGDVYYNRLDNEGTIAGTRNRPLALPVFSTLPPHLERAPATQVVTVPAGQTVDVAEGEYSILRVGPGGVARLTGNAYAFSNVTVGREGSVVCAAACTIVVGGRVSLDRGSALGPASGTAVDASAVLLHVGSDSAGAVKIGRDSSVAANVFAPRAGVTLDRGTELIGAIFGRDIHIGRNSRLTLASAFDGPPVADPQSVFTNGDAPLSITLTGADPEAGALQFAIVSPPLLGVLTAPVAASPTSAGVVYTPSSGANLEDAFTFSVTDPGGQVGTAVVRINPPTEEPPPPDPVTVVAEDRSADVTQETAATLVLDASGPAGVALTYSIVGGSGPFHGNLGAVHVSGMQNVVVYTPDAGYTGGDAFLFQACGVIAGVTVCDSALFTLNVLPDRVEMPELASNVEATTYANKDVLISLGLTSLESLRTTRISANAAFLDSVEVAGTVADANGDGTGDNHMVMPSSVPLFMSAGVGLSGGAGNNGTVRMQFEWDISGLGPSTSSLQSATILLHTHRGTIDSLNTKFYFVTVPGDGLLTDSDFSSPAEAVKGPVMDVPPNMPAGSDGTFSLDVLGELKAALGAGLQFFTIQGRVDESLTGPARGLEVRTSADLNRAEFLEPQLAITTPGITAPLTYTILTLPASGALFDGTTAILQAPYTLSASRVTYQPPQGFVGNTSFEFSVSNGFAVDQAIVSIHVVLPDCASDPVACDDGR